MTFYIFALQNRNQKGKSLDTVLDVCCYEILTTSEQPIMNNHPVIEMQGER